MKFNFILLAIVIAFVICYFFTIRDSVKEGVEPSKLLDHRFDNKGKILSGYEDMLIGIGDDYKLYKFENYNKEWKEIAGKSCCVRDLAYWNKTLLGVGNYDHRLYRWETTGLKSGLWKLVTNLPAEWMNNIGVWKNNLFSTNKTSIFRWSGIADGRQNTPFKSKSLDRPSWHWAAVKVVKSMAEYKHNLYIVDKNDRLEMLVDAEINSSGKLLGQWKRVGQPTEALISITPWNDKLMSLGTDNQLYQWNDERQNWFKKHTDKKLISILALDKLDYDKLFNPVKKHYDCADGFQIEPKEQKRCYRAEGEELTWAAAAQKCKDADSSKKTTLAVISSGNENNFVKDLMHYPKWIGCSNKNKENVWRWPDGKTLKDKGYSNWANSESKNYGNGEHYCEQYSSGSWNAAGPPKNFNAKKPYVCSHFTKQKEGFVGIREGFDKCTNCNTNTIARNLGEQYRNDPNLCRSRGNASQCSNAGGTWQPVPPKPVPKPVVPQPAPPQAAAPQPAPAPVARAAAKAVPAKAAPAKPAPAKPAVTPTCKPPVNLPIPAPTFPSVPAENSIMIVGKDWLTVSRNNLVKTINIDKDYRLEFTIMPTGRIDGWSNILHVTLTGNNCCNPGDRMPGIWFHSKSTRMHIRSGDQTCGNCGMDPPVELPLNKETTVVVEMNNKYMTVAYTGAISHRSTIKRGTQRPTGKAQFFISDDFYQAAQAKVKNMKWTNSSNPPLPKNTVTCRFTVQNVVDSVKYNDKDIQYSGDPKKWKSPKIITFEANPKNPGNLTIQGSSGLGDADGCKNAGLLMSCEAANGNPWNNFGTNENNWSATGIRGKIYRDGTEIPCQSVSGVGLAGNTVGKAIWANTGQSTVKFVGGPRTEPEVKCPKDFQGLALKVLRWGRKMKDGSEILHTEGGDLNIPNKDVIKLKGTKIVRIWPKQPPKGSWMEDNIQERKVSSNGTLYLKTVYNPQWIRIPNEKRACFKDIKSIYVTQGELLTQPNNNACTAGLSYVLHSKARLCPQNIQIKTKLECEKAVAGLGLGERDAGKFPWKTINTSKYPAGCSWTSQADEKGGAMALWNAIPNVAGNARANLHPICYSKAPEDAVLELIKGQGCKTCPAGTYSVKGSKECVVCTKNSTNPRCKEGGRSGSVGGGGGIGSDNVGLVCPAGTSSTGAIIQEEGKPMNLGDDQSTPNTECPAKKIKQICTPECNKTYGKCIAGMCICGAGYTGVTCDEPPKSPPKTLEDWKAEYEIKMAMKNAQEEANKPETVSYGYHEHKKMQTKFIDNLKSLNNEIQELVVQSRQQKEKKRRQRSFLPSEFLAWSQAIPGLLGKTYKKKLGPKPIDVGIAIDDRRKIHFRQQTNKSGGGKNTDLQPVNSNPQILKDTKVIKGDVQEITKGGDLKGYKSFENPKTADYKGYNDDEYLKRPDKPIEKVG